MNPEGTLQLPPQMSTIAPDVDWMYYFVYWVSVAFFVAIVGAMLYFMWRYRRRPGQKAKPTGHSTALEIAWTFLPVILLVYLFHEGFSGYVKGIIPPDDAIDIRVRAMQWNWEFEHRNGVIDEMNMMRVPVNTPVRLIMSSSDVLHSFFVPSLRVKRDVVPGMYSTLWFEATTLTKPMCQSDADCNETRVGGGFESCIENRCVSNCDSDLDCARTSGVALGVDWGAAYAMNSYSCSSHQEGERGECVLPVFCTEYCGAPVGIDRSAERNSNHATMMADLHVVTMEEYEKFIEEGPPPPPECAGEADCAAWGEALYNSSGCIACHAVDGVRQQPAPNWKGLLGSNRAFVEGEDREADLNYITQSIREPQSQIVEGYNNVNMPPYRLSDRQIQAIVAYMRSLDEE